MNVKKNRISFVRKKIFAIDFSPFEAEKYLMKKCSNSEHIKIGDELIITALIKTCNYVDF